MTCIVGLVHDGIVHMAADSAGVAGLSLTVRRDRKIFRTGEFVMGFTTSFRMGQILAYNLTPQQPRDPADLMRYMATDFIDSVRNCLKSGGYTTVSNNVETGGEFLVGYRGRLFHIDSDFQVGEAECLYDACGCGADIALGSLASTEGAPHDRIMRALGAAHTHSAGIRPPFYFELTEKTT